MVAALIRFLIGDTSADWLQVPRSPWDRLVTLAPAALGVLERLEDASPAGRLGPRPPR
ncbi:hypothetical protein GCM10020229_65900 [Kitasatospora albolonga]